MNSPASWEKGKGQSSRSIRSGFGAVYAALDKSSNDYVAIKRLRVMANDASIETEAKVLKECQSRYIVRYYNVEQREGELWVRIG